MTQKKIQIFFITENTFVDVDVDVDVQELNDVLRISGHTQVNENDDSEEINVEDYDRDDDDEIEEEQDNSD